MCVNTRVYVLHVCLDEVPELCYSDHLMGSSDTVGNVACVFVWTRVSVNMVVTKWYSLHSHRITGKMIPVCIYLFGCQRENESTSVFAYSNINNSSVGWLFYILLCSNPTAQNMTEEQLCWSAFIWCSGLHFNPRAWKMDRFWQLVCFWGILWLFSKPL